jgi:hypothetical protein
MAGANAEYVIDVATTFSGAQTIGQLDTLTEKLVAGGTGADVFHDAIAKVTNQLTAAKAATMAANAELVEGNTRYQELERVAQAASIAFEKAGKTGVVPPGVEAAYRMTEAAVNDQAEALKALEASAKAAGAEEVRLGSTLKNVSALSSHTAKGVAEVEAANAKAAKSTSLLGESVEDLGKPILNLIPGLKDYTRKLGESGQAGLYAIGAYAGLALTVAAVTVAFLAGTLAIAGWAIGLADANRNAGLAAEAQEALHPELVAFRDTIAQVADETGAHTDELQQWIGTLKEAKVTAKDIPGALRAIALSEAALGKGGSADFLKDIKAGKVAVDDLSTSINSKLGGIVRAQMKGLNAQSGIFKRNVDSLFGGLDIEPALDGLQRLVALFDENTAAGAAIKVMFEGVFQPLINSVDKASVVVEAFVLGVLIGLTKLYIQAKPVIRYLEDLFGFEDPATADTMATITSVAEKLVPVMVILAGIFTALALVVGVSLVAALAGLAAPFVIIAGVIYGVVAALSGLYDAWGGIVKFLKSITLEDVGNALISGLTVGIINSGPAVLKALGGVVDGAIAGVKGMLGIHSPSTVFAEIGDNTGQGFVQGVEGTEGDTQAAMTSLVEPPRPGASPAASAPATSSSGGSAGTAMNFAGANFNFYGVKDAENAKQSFGEMLTEFLKKDAASISGHINTEPAT